MASPSKTLRWFKLLATFGLSLLCRFLLSTYGTKENKIWNECWRVNDGKCFTCMLFLCSFCSSAPPEAISRRVHPHQPAPAHGFFLLEGSGSCHSCLFRGQAPGFCHEPVSSRSYLNQVELKWSWISLEVCDNLSLKCFTNVQRCQDPRGISQMLGHVCGTANKRNVWNHMLSQLPLQPALWKWKRITEMGSNPTATVLLAERQPLPVLPVWLIGLLLPSYSSPNIKITFGLQFACPPRQP